MIVKPMIHKQGILWWLGRITRRGYEVEAFPTWDAAMRAAAELRSHYGPTDQDPEPGKRWCYDCGHEVYGFKEGDICSGCGRQSEEP